MNYSTQGTEGAKSTKQTLLVFPALRADGTDSQTAQWLQPGHVAAQRQSIIAAPPHDAELKNTET